MLSTINLLQQIWGATASVHYTWIISATGVKINIQSCSPILVGCINAPPKTDQTMTILYISFTIPKLKIKTPRLLFFTGNFDSLPSGLLELVDFPTHGNSKLDPMQTDVKHQKSYPHLRTTIIAAFSHMVAKWHVNTTTTRHSQTPGVVCSCSAGLDACAREQNLYLQLSICLGILNTHQSSLDSITIILTKP